MAVEQEETGAAAVDVGGTFTDLVYETPEGLTALKVPSTPGSPETGVAAALEAMGRAPYSLTHGSTVATNAILERNGAKTAFITTGGFSDIIEIGRQNRLRLYNLQVEKPEPLVPRRLRFEAAERVGADGEVLLPLTRSSAAELAETVRRSPAEAAAVCLLFSFEHPEHEQIIAEELSRVDIPVSTSSEVLPEYREYERASTTVINAYVMPLVQGYIDRLRESLSTGDDPKRFRLMHSAGGTISADTARSLPAGLVLSGPAGGVVAAQELGLSLGETRIISFDMGGTSTDVSLIDGEPTVTREAEVSGLPLALPMIDIHTIGSGGGSIAHTDEAGVLKVGPLSAGADPGPACYGKGLLPTVTDANMLLGRLEPDWFAGGKMRLEPGRSLESILSLGGRKDPLATARAVIDVTLSHMEKALKKVSLEKGRDPRDFSLVAFGGAGPMHACELAERLSIPRVIVPLLPGLFSSLGMLVSRPGREYSRTVLYELEESRIPLLGSDFLELKEKATGDMLFEGYPRSRLELKRSLTMRYRGQSHEIPVPVKRLALANLLSEFELAYHQLYGYLRPGTPVEVVNTHLSCRVRTTGGLPPAPGVEVGRKPEPTGKELYFSRIMKGSVYARNDLCAGHRITGPALIAQKDSTTVVPPGWRCEIDRSGNIILERVG